ncbi:MAG: gamma-glutamylcyclotransferase [Chitinophagaceae bacterium]|nr:MAG: gamma-glutamylcyclotransferase [Chitinophagaceae bacterium]
MDTSTYQLFVYGSLRSGFRNPVYNYLTKYFHLLGDAVVKGKFYDAGANPVAIPTADEESYIHGELYVVNNPDEFGWAIEQLDDYEGINVEAGEKPLYRREITEAFQDGKGSMTWIYWFNGSVEGMSPIHFGDILKYLQEKNKPNA